MITNPSPILSLFHIIPSLFHITSEIHLNYFRSVNPFPNNKFWTLPNGKSLQTTILNALKMAESSPDRVENTVAKGKTSFFPTVFSKDLYS